MTTLRRYSRLRQTAIDLSHPFPTPRKEQKRQSTCGARELECRRETRCGRERGEKRQHQSTPVRRSDKNRVVYRVTVAQHANRTRKQLGKTNNRRVSPCAATTLAAMTNANVANHRTASAIASTSPTKHVRQEARTGSSNIRVLRAGGH